MNVQQAIEAPRWTTRSFPASPAPHTMYPGDLQVEDRIPQAVRADLLSRGHKLSVSGAYSIGSNRPSYRTRVRALWRPRRPAQQRTRFGVVICFIAFIRVSSRPTGSTLFGQSAKTKGRR